MRKNWVWVMANFNEAFEIILKQEGGFSDSSLDKGGATKYGISLRFLSKLGMLGDVDNDGDIDVDDIKLLNVSDAEEIYKKYFWKQLDGINSQKIANFIFSIAVNAGNRRAGIIVQHCINKYSNHNRVIVDGVIGSKTITAINESTNISFFCSLLTLELIDFYRGIVNNNPNQNIFLLGWLNRAFDCLL